MAETVKIVDLDIDEKDLLKKLTKLGMTIKDLKDETKKLEKANKELDKEGKKNTAQYKENSKQIETNKINTKGLSTEYRDNQKVLVTLNTTESKQLGTLQQLELSNKKLREESKQLDLTRKSGQDRLKVINKQLDTNNETILKNADATKAQKMNIGAYGSALGGLGGPLARATQGVQMLTAALKFLLINPIGLILLAIAGAVKVVGSAIKSNQGALDKFKATGDGIRAAWAAATDRVNDFGEAVMRLDFKGMILAFVRLGDEMAAEAKIARMLTEVTIGLEDAMIGGIVTKAKLRHEIEKARLASKEAGISANEELAFFKEAMKWEEKLLVLEKAEAEERAKIVSAQVGLGRSLRDEMKAEQEALAKVVEVETASMKRRRTLASTMRTLVIKAAKENVEIAEASALIAAKAVDNEIQLERIKSITITEIGNQEVESKKLKSKKIVEITQEQIDAELELARLVSESKLDIAQSYLKGIVNLFGAQSKIGKLAAVSETAINTYRGAQAAYASLAGIPVVGPGLGIAAAGAAVLMGLANVKKILAVKTPGGGGGAGIPGGGGRTSISTGSNLGGNYAAGALSDGGTTTRGITDSAAAAIKQGISEALKESPPVLVIEDVTQKQMQQDSISKVTTV